MFIHCSRCLAGHGELCADHGRWRVFTWFIWQARWPNILPPKAIARSARHVTLLCSRPQGLSWQGRPGAHGGPMDDARMMTRLLFPDCSCSSVTWALRAAMESQRQKSGPRPGPRHRHGRIDMCRWINVPSRRHVSPRCTQDSSVSFTSEGDPPKWRCLSSGPSDEWARARVLVFSAQRSEMWPLSHSMLRGQTTIPRVTPPCLALVGAR